MASLAGITPTCMIDTLERRAVATADIPGALLQTKMSKGEEDMHIILGGRMADLLEKLAPETYQKYVHQRHKQAYIYCRVNIAIYGTLKTALLFSGRNCLRVSSSKDILSIRTTDVLPTKTSMENNALLF